jgi:putative ABC transport system substrate-binding protein
MKRRRTLLAWLVAAPVAALLATASRAQRADGVRRIGVLSLRTRANDYDAAFLDAMRELGWVEGRNLNIEYRWAAGDDRRVPTLAAELVAAKVEVIVTAAAPLIAAAKQTTSTIPIVMAAVSDPVGSGLIASLGRPGGNITGLTLSSSDTGAKRLQLLQELIPGATRIAVLVSRIGLGVPGESTDSLLLKELQLAAAKLRMQLSVVEIQKSEDLPAAFAAIERGRAQAVLVQQSPLVSSSRGGVVDLAARHRLPVIYESDLYVQLGGLISYGPSIPQMYRRAAYFVDRILKGAKPAELPVEQPSKFDLAINLKAAAALGLKVPRTVLLRADRVIE